MQLHKFTIITDVTGPTRQPVAHEVISAGRAAACRTALGVHRQQLADAGITGASRVALHVAVCRQATVQVPVPA